MPVVRAGNAGGVGIGRLMTGSTVQAGHTCAFRPPDDIEQVRMPVIPLLRIVRRGVAIDTTGIGQDGVNLLPSCEASFTRC